MNITNDKVTDYINSFYSPLNPQLEAMRAEAEDNYIPIILREAEELILNLIQMKKPKRILEIGTAIGYSSICFALAYHEANITTLELDDQMYRIASQNIEDAGLSNRISVILGDARESIIALKDHIQGLEENGFDMVFIDAAKGHYKEFWDDCIPLCKPDAVIICDNVLLKARTASDDYITLKKHKAPAIKMREYVNYISNLDYAKTSILSVGDGISISILRG